MATRFARWAKCVQVAGVIVSAALLCALLMAWTVALSGAGFTFSRFGPFGIEASFARASVGVLLYRGFPETYGPKWTSGTSSQRYFFEGDYDYSYHGEGGPRKQTVGAVAWSSGHTYYRPKAGGDLVRVDWRYFVLPMWLMVAATAAWPVYWLAFPLRRARLIARRRKRGLCESCGYDLRESGARCPECGRGVASAA